MEVHCPVVRVLGMRHVALVLLKMGTFISCNGCGTPTCLVVRALGINGLALVLLKMATFTSFNGCEILNCPAGRSVEGQVAHVLGMRMFALPPLKMAM